MQNIPPIIQIGDVLISSDIITEQFCCDLSVCHGACCVEGDAGAPVTTDEIMQMEDALDIVWPSLSASAQAVIDRQGVAYTDEEGDLVTSIVNGRDCVFTCYGQIDANDIGANASERWNNDGQLVAPKLGGVGSHCCLCALEKAWREGRSKFCKPISCSLYPIREKTFRDGTVGLNYHRWKICQCGRDLGQNLKMPLYRFLREPLIRRFGQEWYSELCSVAQVLTASED